MSLCNCVDKLKAGTGVLFITEHETYLLSPHFYKILLSFRTPTNALDNRHTDIEHRWFSGGMLACLATETQKHKNNKFFGGAGYRSRYLSHAKRALYHLSYAPSLIIVLNHKQSSLSCFLQ